MCASTEMTYASVLAGWIEEISSQQGLPFTRARVEQTTGTGKRADILVYDGRNQVVLVIEVKRPENIEDPSEVSVVKQAFAYVEELCESKGYDVKYVATHNVNFLHLWSDVGGQHRLEQFAITSVGRLEEFEGRSEEIKKAFTRFLFWFHQFLHLGAKPRPFAESTIEILKNYVSGLLSATKLVRTQIDSYNTDPKYREMVADWLVDEGATKLPSSPQEIETTLRVLSMQYVVLFINKLLFYNVLRLRTELPEFRLDEGITPLTFSSFAETYFKAAQMESGDFETVFQTGFIDSIPLDSATVREMQKLSKYLHRIDFSTLSYDMLGAIFESFIERESRHRLGQFFTTSDVTDLILGFCVKSRNDIVLDPACGSGTFLTRAYYRLTYLGQADHRSKLERLWGVDIARFPIHLATINLATRFLSDTRVFPRVSQSDFFYLEPSETVHLGAGQTTLEIWMNGAKKSARVRDMRDTEVDVVLPEFTAVVGNPPYIRQEKIKGKASEQNYRDFLKKSLGRSWPKNETVANLPDNANIYAHFFIHGGGFLSGDGKRLGFVSMRSWLESGFGSHLQRFFLENFKVIAVLESKVERWFEDAQMLPVVTILERESDKERRDSNFVRFVRFNQPLSKIFPAAGVLSSSNDTDTLTSRLSQETVRWMKVDEVIEVIEGLSVTKDSILEPHSLDFADVTVVAQAQLQRSKTWAEYLRMFPVYLSIIQKDWKRKAQDRLLTDRDLAFFKRRGITAGEKNILTFPSPWFMDFRVGARTVTMTPNQEMVDGNIALDTSPISMPSDWFFPMIDKIRTQHRYATKVSEVESRVFSCSVDPDSLKKKGNTSAAEGLERYINIGKLKNVTRRKTLQQRAKSRGGRWYDLKLQVPDGYPFFIPSLFGGSRMFVLFCPEFKPNKTTLFSSDNYWELWMARQNANQQDYLLMAALLNSAFMYAGFEFNGRLLENRDHTKSIQIKGPELDRLHYIDPEKVSAPLRKKIIESFQVLCNRSFESIILEVQKRDRQTLDSLILCQHLGISSQEMWGFYIDLCTSSIERTRMWVNPLKWLKRASAKCLIEMDVSVPPDSESLEVPVGRPLSDLFEILLGFCHRNKSNPVVVNMMAMRLEPLMLVISFSQSGVEWKDSEVSLIEPITENAFPLFLLRACVESFGGQLVVKKRRDKEKNTSTIQIHLPYRSGA